MNTHDVERRLEALAASSANPAVPTALLDRMTQLEADREPALAPVQVERLRPQDRIRSRGNPRSRGLVLLGMAAALAVVGGLVYVGGSHLVHKAPAPTSTPTLMPSSQVPRPSPQLQPWVEPKPSISIGSWRKLYTFTGQWTFGGVSTEGPVRLSWQNGEIVGIATRRNSLNEEQTCVLQSRDGTGWICSVLPVPVGLVCQPAKPCFIAAGLAVHDGRWVVVGQTPFDGSSGALPTLLVWTSADGMRWVEQTADRSMPAAVRTSDPDPEPLVSTANGFLMSTCSNDDGPGLWTSADGVNWQPATYSSGSLPLRCPIIGTSSTAGYMAVGVCYHSYDGCTATSTDGVNWTTHDPLADAAANLGGNRRLLDWPAPAYVGGRWIVYIATSAPTGGDDGYYAVSSPDGVRWSLAHVPWPDILNAPSTPNGSESNQAAHSPLGPNGYWALYNGKRSVWSSAAPSPGYVGTDASANVYWSGTALNWQAVASAPPGDPIAVVETPSGLVAFMNAPLTEANPNRPTSVWVADKK